MEHRASRGRRGRRLAAALGLLLTACATVAPGVATAQERATCSEVYGLGAIVDALLSGRVPPGDDATVGALVRASYEVKAASWMAGNQGLARDGARLAAAAETLDAPTGGDTFETSPQALVLALRSLIQRCESLGVDADDSAPVADRVAPTLRSADLGAGWERRPHDPEDDRQAGRAAEFRRCVGEGRTLPWGPMIHSDDFVRQGGAQQVRSSVMTAARRDTHALAAQLADPAAPACMARMVRQSVANWAGSSLALQDLATGPVDIGGVSGLRTTLLLEIDGESLTVVVDDLFLAEGTWFGHLQLIGTFEPLAGSEPVVAAFRDRLAQAPRTG